MTLSRRIVAEALGTAFLLATVVGSGIMGEKLAGGNTAIALLANTFATGAMLATLIFTFGPISGAHFNPAVTLADASQGGIRWGETPAYIVAQLVGAFIGVGAAHLMFGEALIQVSKHARAGGGQLFSEFIATFGLLCVIWGCARLRSQAVPIAVGLYITGAYWFTASTSFANPAVTLARAFTDTFAGIRPVDAPGFIVAQLLGAFTATFLFRWLVPSLPLEAKEAVFSMHIPVMNEASAGTRIDFPDSSNDVSAAISPSPANSRPWRHGRDSSLSRNLQRGSDELVGSKSAGKVLNAKAVLHEHTRCIVGALTNAAI